MTRHVRIPLLIAVVLALCAAPASAAEPLYKDPSQPVNSGSPTSCPA
jgi:FlaG/FlaF family flagellin (archaellin)